MSNLKRFSSRKEVTEFLKEKGIDTSNWSEEKWLSINKGQAEIHMMALAEKIYDSVNESTPKQLNPGEWHIPFADKIGMYSTTNESPLEKLSMEVNHTGIAYQQDMEELAIKISVAMAARTSYTIVGDEKEVDYKKMIELHDRLLSQTPPHSSPLEHCAVAMSDEEYESFIKGKLVFIDDIEDYNIEEPLFEEKGWCNNFKGFIPYRYLVDNKLL